MSKIFTSATDNVKRLESIESSLSSLQETKLKTEHDISKIKQWRDNFVKV